MHMVPRLFCPLVRNTLCCCLKLQIGKVYFAIQVELHWNTAVLQSEATKAEAPCWLALRIFRLFSFRTKIVKEWKVESGAHKLSIRITGDYTNWRDSPSLSLPWLPIILPSHGFLERIIWTYYDSTGNVSHWWHLFHLYFNELYKRAGRVYVWVIMPVCMYICMYVYMYN
jgi:hypothetical protein